MCGKFQGPPPANDASLDRFLMANLNDEMDHLKNGLLPNGPKWADSEKNLVRFILNFIRPQSDRVTELQSYKHPRVLSIRVGEICLCLISINSPTRLARRGMIFFSSNFLSNQILLC